MARVNANPARRSSRWTPRLRWLTAICSGVFTIGTALQNFVIVDLEMLEHTMRLAGQTPAEAAANAPGFLTGFRAVGCAHLAGNALGLLALRGRVWVFWVVLAVNGTALLLSPVLLGFLAHHPTPWTRPQPHPPPHIYREGIWSRDLR